MMHTIDVSLEITLLITVVIVLALAAAIIFIGKTDSYQLANRYAGIRAMLFWMIVYGAIALMVLVVMIIQSVSL